MNFSFILYNIDITKNVYNISNLKNILKKYVEMNTYEYLSSNLLDYSLPKLFSIFWIKKIKLLDVDNIYMLTVKCYIEIDNNIKIFYARFFITDKNNPEIIISFSLVYSDNLPLDNNDKFYIKKQKIDVFKKDKLVFVFFIFIPKIILLIFKVIYLNFINFIIINCHHIIIEF